MNTKKQNRMAVGSPSEYNKMNVQARALISFARTATGGEKHDIDSIKCAKSEANIENCSRVYSRSILQSPQLFFFLLSRVHESIRLSNLTLSSWFH